MAQYAFSSLKDEYTKLWAEMQVVKVTAANSEAQRIIAPAAKARYKTVEDKTGVPWFVVGCLHMRESDANFNTWLHNGDPMHRNGVAVQTVNVPAHRPPNPNVSWEEGADDALVTCENLNEIKDWGPEHVAYAAEKFNGFGYRSPARNIPSPYLWGGTSVQKPGKFVRDGVYDSSVMDPQIGAMATLKQIMLLDPTAKFAAPAPKVVPPPEPTPEELPTPVSPKADDNESDVKPITKSKTIVGGFIQWLGGVGVAVAGMFQYIATPWGFATLVFMVAVISIGLYLVIKGRLDVQGIIKHLSQDDSGGS